MGGDLCLKKIASTWFAKLAFESTRPIVIHTHKYCSLGSPQWPLPKHVSAPFVIESIRSYHFLLSPSGIRVTTRHCCAGECCTAISPSSHAQSEPFFC